ncbi:MAG: GntR family transcriptional regulator [Actinobacteria bacterium]|nr:GntR family transcriptional regulator [Actinomycetota bacterium]
MQRTSGPLYAQTADVLRGRLADKVWKQGDRLPSETDLCREFGVSSITMRRAVGMLAAEGLVIRIQGKGTFASGDHTLVLGPPQLTSFTQDMERRGWRSSARIVSVSFVPASVAVATKLGLAQGGPTTVVKRVRFADEAPVALQTAHLPSLFFPGLERYDFARESLYGVLERVYEVKPANASETYRASTVDEEEAELLDVPPGSPAFRVERVTSDGAGRRIELVESVIRGDRYTLALRLSASRQPGRGLSPVEGTPGET